MFIIFTIGTYTTMEYYDISNSITEFKTWLYFIPHLFIIVIPVLKYWEKKILEFFSLQ